MVRHVRSKHGCGMYAQNILVVRIVCVKFQHIVVIEVLSCFFIDRLKSVTLNGWSTNHIQSSKFIVIIAILMSCYYFLHCTIYIAIVTDNKTFYALFLLVLEFWWNLLKKFESIDWRWFKMRKKKIEWKLNEKWTKIENMKNWKIETKIKRKFSKNRKK